MSFLSAHLKPIMKTHKILQYFETADNLNKSMNRYLRPTHLNDPNVLYIKVIEYITKQRFTNLTIYMF